MAIKIDNRTLIVGGPWNGRRTSKDGTFDVAEHSPAPPINRGLEAVDTNVTVTRERYVMQFFFSPDSDRAKVKIFVPEGQTHFQTLKLLLDFYAEMHESIEVSKHRGWVRSQDGTETVRERRPGDE